MTDYHYINSNHIDFESLRTIIHTNLPIKLSDEAIENIEKCRAYLDEKIKNNHQKELKKQKLN